MCAISNIKRVRVGVLICLVLILLIMVLFSCTSDRPDTEVPSLINPATLLKNVNLVCIRSICFEVEIPQTAEEFRQGLMYRVKLDSNNGMLFIFDEEAVHSFWMKNTLIPLDIIWINSNYEVVYIRENTPPCEADPCPVYNLNTPALYVLEVNGGSVEEYGINIGDKAEIKIVN